MFMPKIATAFRPPYGLGYGSSGPFCLFCLLVASVTCSPFTTHLAGGATYYLDAVNGNDSNPGTSGAPWKTLARSMINYCGTSKKESHLSFSGSIVSI